MSTEMTSSDFLKAAKGPLGLVWDLGRLAYKGAKAANAAAREREQIAKYKSELQEIGLGDRDSVQAAMREGIISYDDYRTIISILES